MKVIDKLKGDKMEQFDDYIIYLNELFHATCLYLQLDSIIKMP